MSGVLYGLAAAIGLGINQILITFATRRWGTIRSTLSTLVIAFFFLVAFAALQGWEIPLDGDGLLLLLIGLGLAAAVAYVTGYQSLLIGPLSVVSPIGATAGAMTVLAAFLFLSERPSPIQWIGIPLATIGAVLVSVEIEPGARVRLISKGPIFAALSVVAGAISNAVLRVPVRDIGPMAAILFQRAFTIIYVAIAFAFVIQRRSVPTRAGISAEAVEPGNPAPAIAAEAGTGQRRAVRWWLLLAAIGLLDAASFVFFARGLVVAPAWLIGLLSQSGRVIAVAGGLILFREHLRRDQWYGIVLVVVGLVLAVGG